MHSPIRETRFAWNESGHAHFVTYSCYRRWPLQARDRSRRWVIDALKRVRREQDVALWAYVIMPEHVHVLLHPRAGDYAMRRILARAQTAGRPGGQDALAGHRSNGVARASDGAVSQSPGISLLAAGRRLRPQHLPREDRAGSRVVHS